MGSKERIRHYIDYKGITYYEFEKKATLTHGVLKTGKEFRADQLRKIRDNFPDINMEWLIYEEGEMESKKPYFINKSSANDKDEKKDKNLYKEKYIEVLEENRALQNQLNSRLSDIKIIVTNELSKITLEKLLTDLKSGSIKLVPNNNNNLPIG